MNKRVCFFVIFLSALMPWCVIQASEDDQTKISGFISSVKSAPGQAGSFFKGIGESFGMTPGSEYKLSYGIYNDTPYKIFAAKRFVANVQGANIWKDIDLLRIIDPFSNSGKAFYNMQQRFSVVVDYDTTMNNNASSYKKKIDDATKASKSSGVVVFEHNEVTLGDTTATGYSDPYIVHAYFKQGNVNVEFLGQRSTTTGFAGVFYNNTNNPVNLEFAKDALGYKVTLESHSFNTLSSSDASASIRPLASSNETRKFVFSGGVTGAIGIPATGMVDVVYTYEIYNKTIGIQGFMPGNYDLVPVDNAGKQAPTRMRDINPVACSVWIQTPEQQKTPAQPGMEYFSESNPLWLIYKSKDQAFIKKLTPGAVNDVTIMRPQIDEKEAWLYAVMVVSNDEAATQRFLTRLQNGQIPGLKDAITTTLLSDAPINLDDKKGILQDTGQGGSGVTAYLLLADVFLPTGLGSAPLYYTLTPSMIALDQLASMIVPYLDAQQFKAPQGSKETPDQIMFNEVRKKCMQWINEYIAQQKSDDFRNYMMTRGTATLFAAAQPGATTKSLSPYGEGILKNLLTGPISIARYPVIRFAANNNFSAAPEGMEKVPHVKL